MDEDGDGIDDASMVEVVKEKRWHEISEILETLNDHERVKRVRMFVFLRCCPTLTLVWRCLPSYIHRRPLCFIRWYAWNAFFRDATIGIIFFILFWMLSPTSPSYGEKLCCMVCLSLQV